MNVIVTAQHIAARGKVASVREWIRVTSIRLKLKQLCPVSFNGDVDTRPVHAYVSNSRWLAICDAEGCGGCEYVDPAERLFFCMACGNDGSGKARPVRFPENYQEIEKALLERVMIPAGGRDLITMTMSARPLHPSLRRDWMPKELESLYQHPQLNGRVWVNAFGESPEDIHEKTIRVTKVTEYASSI